MKAAIYARFSSDKQRESSIEDQRRNCRNYALRQEWLVIKNYADKAISGSKSDRPEYQRMLADAKAKLFDALLVDDLSRLARDSVENEQTLRRLEHWGIRVIGISDGYDSVSKGRKVQRGVRGLINEIYLEDLAEKTHRGQTGQALKGNNCGGRAYGYRHVPIEDKSQLDQFGRPVVVAVRRERDPEQTKIVQEIFKRYVEGWAPRSIAEDLNKRRIPSPGASWKRVTRRADGKWLGSTIVSMLGNPLYIGRYIWNRSHWVKDPDTNKKQRRERPESEWISTNNDKLAIVDKRIWDAVQARRKQREALRNNQHPDIRPRQKYLFSGILVCAECGQKYVISDAYRYGCGSHINGGKHACSNDLKVSRALVEDKLLEGIKRELFTPEALAYMRKRIVELQAERKKAKQPNMEAARRDLAEAEKKIAGYIKAIEDGAYSPTLKTKLEEAERRKVELEAALKVDTRQADKVVQLVPDLTNRYRALVGDLGKVMQRDVSRARAQIRTLLGGQVTLHPTKEGYLEAEMAGDYAGLLKLASNGSANLNLHGSGGRI